jgi:D-3-phosphoglycerate dehydrogenase
VTSGSTDVSLVEQQLTGIDYEMDVHVCRSDGETIEAIKGADVVINQGVPMPRAVIEEIDTAKAIVSFGHGFDRIDDEAATEKSVMVINTAGFCTEEVSNHAIMLLLACSKHLTVLDDLVKAGRWSNDTRASIGPMGPIDGQTLGLIGLGNIARATARKAKAFGLEVIAQDPYVEPWIAKEYGVELVSGLEELAGRSDYVSVHVPLNPQTTKLVGESFFKAMKPTAFIINTCRGRTIDEKSLIKALQEGELAGAGLDVFEVEPTPADNPLLSMDNVIVTPHSAGASVASRDAAPTQIGQEAARLLTGRWPMSLVNPQVRAQIPTRPPATGV